MKQNYPQSVNYLFEKAELITFRCIKVLFNKVLTEEERAMINLHCGKQSFPIARMNQQQEVVYLALKEDYPFGENCYLSLGEKNCFIDLSSIVRTKEFDERFFYNGTDLGAIYTKEETTFTCWAPTAMEVRVVLYKTWYTETRRMVMLSRENSGTWRVKIKEDLETVWYVYEVYVNGKWNRAVDPYATFVSVNGERAMVGSMDKTEPAEWPELTQALKLNETIIYELHIRDFTIGRNNGIEGKALYTGLTEVNKSDKEGNPTGLDYLKQLGVTHIELLPVNDYGSVDESNRFTSYNWGYDPVHYFVPEGSYATDPYNGYTRVRELKRLIAACHRSQLRVILDVVFNHIYIWELSHLEKIVPGYYFRYQENGEISNGTGVGNDLATERRMVRKLIVDCISFWMKEYKIDGFRFDLMGILDLETIKSIATTAKNINPNVFLLGEGWDLPTAFPEEKRATTNQAKDVSDIGFFQDEFRDALKGSTFHQTDTGFCSGNETSLNQILAGISGSEYRFLQPAQAIHYVESHDNHTLWDKLRVSLPKELPSTLMRRHRLATSIILLAQGIPFLHAGQEWYRTKYGVENSYCSPDWINQFDWERRRLFHHYVSYVKGLINIRRAHGAFRLETYSDIHKHLEWMVTDPLCIAYSLKNVNAFGRWNDIIVVHNANEKAKQILLPKKGNWEVVVDENSASLIPLYTLYNKDYVRVAPLSTTVCVQ
ncbi:type I pullulanase [Halalkalibacter urbisdiaboli]|uniref:type I pullulanase n=1 Tax=Halalkalibacter urbisdiaboli TaxID=1960589 RepID=UPI000B44FDD5|nr:type I pullulanase [Halalkalibacter urbisdiaboli]